MKINELDTPWFVFEEKGDRFPEVTWQRICYQFQFGPTEMSSLPEMSSLQCFRDYSYTRRRQHTAGLMADPLALYEAMQELLQLLEEHQLPWYLREYFNLAANALTGAKPLEEAT